jgi:FdrA protein
MITAQRIIRNLYRDSVSLMQLSDEIQSMNGISQASAIMASENNIQLLVDSGLLPDLITPSPNDLLILVEGENQEFVDKAIEAVEDLLTKRADDTDSAGVQVVVPHSIQMSLEPSPDANLVLISTPGAYAAAEALKAMRLGLHVMMFSDNVGKEDEIMLKQFSNDHDLLFMGPDCGTAIINGIPLGFANVVKRGNIGVVAASGTGLQQVTSLIDRWGGGISQAIGTGGHDLSAKVGAITMKQGIRALAADPDTKVIVLISKPPSPDVIENVLKEARNSEKPVVINFIGADPNTIKGKNLYGVPTLEAAAAASISLSNGELPEVKEARLSSQLAHLAVDLPKNFDPRQKYIRGLFSGGTFCFETLHLLGQQIGPVFSNIPIHPEGKLENVWQSQKHTAIDLGDDLFTQGRPHPMIDFRLRNDRLLQEAQDPETAVILLDIVLGYGSNMDPAAEIVPTILKARTIAQNEGRNLVFIASVCGTEQDPQNLALQEKELRNAGVVLTESNAQAALLAAAVIAQIKG